MRVTCRIWIAVVFVVAAAGCSSGATMPMTVELRDGATQQPVASALIVVRPVEFFIPAWPFSTLDSSPPHKASGVTGADGTVRLPAVTDVPSQVIALAPGYVSQRVYLEAHPGTAGATEWRLTDPEEDEDKTDQSSKRLEIRFLP